MLAQKRGPHCQAAQANAKQEDAGKCYLSTKLKSIPRYRRDGENPAVELTLAARSRRRSQTAEAGLNLLRSRNWLECPASCRPQPDDPTFSKSASLELGTGRNARSLGGMQVSAKSMEYFLHNNCCDYSAELLCFCSRSCT